MYVIHKSTRVPLEKSYFGPTWDQANIRDMYQEQYADKAFAESIAAILTKYNPVGFCVAKVLFEEK